MGVSAINRGVPSSGLPEPGQPNQLTCLSPLLLRFLRACSDWRLNEYVPDRDAQALSSP